MSAFLTDLVLTDLEPDQMRAPADERRWMLLADLIYRSDRLGRLVVAPRGYITDLASAPRLVWPVCPPFGRYGKAAVLHDWLYYTRLCPRAEADAVFLEAMAVGGVGGLRRRLLWAAVRLFGGRAYAA